MKNSKCGDKPCFSKKSFKDLDDYINKKGKLQTKITGEAAKLYKKAQCHPLIKKHVTPRVNQFFSLFPIVFFTAPWTWFLDFILLWIPGINVIEILWLLFIQTPWNMFWFLTCFIDIPVLFSFLLFLQMIILGPIVLFVPLSIILPAAMFLLLIQTYLGCSVFNIFV